MFGWLVCRIKREHVWGDWRYISDDSCEQIRTCRRNNGHTENRIEHDWSDWKYISDDSCEQIRTCRRNDGHTGNRIEHDWSEKKVSGDYDYVPEFSYVVPVLYYPCKRKGCKCRGGVEYDREYDEGMRNSYR